MSIVKKQRPVILKEESVVKEPVVKALKKRPVILTEPCDDEMGSECLFSSEQVEAMTDSELKLNWINAGLPCILGCKHCGWVKNGGTEKQVRQTDIGERWMMGIRAQCMKKGLYKGIKLPATCDKQRVMNELKRSVDNPYYYRIKNGPPMTKEEREQLDKEHAAALLELGIQRRHKKKAAAMSEDMSSDEE